MDVQDLEYRVGKLELKAGDVLVVKLTCDAPVQHLAALRESLVSMRNVLGCRSIILPYDVDLSVLTGEEIAARLAASSPTPEKA